MHPLTHEALSKLEYDHVVNYRGNLKEDLELIIDQKLQRYQEDWEEINHTRIERGFYELENPLERVIHILQKMLYFIPDYQSGEPIKFQNAAELIKDTAKYYQNQTK